MPHKSKPIIVISNFKRCNNMDNQKKNGNFGEGAKEGEIPQIK